MARVYGSSTGAQLKVNYPFLSWWEEWLVRRLIRSKRIGAIAIKQFGQPVTWYLSDPSDPMIDTDGLDEEEGTIMFGAGDDEIEPDSMLLERLYHAPDAER